MAKKTYEHIVIGSFGARLLRSDAKKFNKALGGIGERILTWFITTRTPAEREAFYKSCPNKTMGRKVSA